MKKVVYVAIVFALLFLTFQTSCFAESPVYVVLGDSIAKGTGIENPQSDCFGSLVASHFGFDYYNFGVDGDIAQDLLNYLDDSEVQNAIIKADYISISIGGNDYLQNNVVGLAAGAFKGDYSKIEMILDEFYPIFSSIISKLKGLSPSAEILVQNLYNPRTDITRRPADKAIKKLNKRYEKYLEENPGAYKLVDIYTPMGKNRENFAEDTIHPSEEGHRIIADEIIKAINNQQPQIKNDSTKYFWIFVSMLVVVVIAVFYVGKKK